MALSLRNPVAREWVNQQREKVKPWSEFLDFSQFRKPESPAELKKTFIKNIEVFHANYMVRRHFKFLKNLKEFCFHFLFSGAHNFATSLRDRHFSLVTIGHLPVFHNYEFDRIKRT